MNQSMVSPKERAANVIEIERRYQGRKFGDGTAANPDIPMHAKIGWFMEEFLEAMTAWNDLQATHGSCDPRACTAYYEFMHEVVQMTAVGKAMIEGFVERCPTFDTHVKMRRKADAERLNLP